MLQEIQIIIWISSVMEMLLFSFFFYLSQSIRLELFPFEHISECNVITKGHKDKNLTSPLSESCDAKKKTTLPAATTAECGSGSAVLRQLVCVCCSRLFCKDAATGNTQDSGLFFFACAVAKTTAIREQRAVMFPWQRRSGRRFRVLPDSEERDGYGSVFLSSVEGWFASRLTTTEFEL